MMHIQLKFVYTGFRINAKPLFSILTDDINIFVYGAGDCRHILKTVAKSYRHTKKKLHVSTIYICSACTVQHIYGNFHCDVLFTVNHNI